MNPTDLVAAAAVSQEPKRKRVLTPKQKARVAERNRTNYLANREARLAYQRAYSAENREAIDARRSVHYAANRDAVAKKRHAHYVANQKTIQERKRARKYDLTLERLRAIVAPGKCEICGGTDRLHVDHNHATGVVRGLLCNACNFGIGFFSDDPGRVAAAASYLRRNTPALREVA